jgi:PleD family two-component response regulator
VEYAINGYAALSVAQSFRRDVVFWTGLPGPDGFEVCRPEKTPDRAARVIALLAADEDSRSTGRRGR